MIIVHVISTLEKCGPVNVLYGIASNLPSGCKQYILTLAQEPEASRLVDLESIGVKVIQVYGSRIDSMIRPGKLTRKLREIDPDVVHVHGVRACRLCVNCPYPVIATVHNGLYSDFVHEYGRAVGRLLEKIQMRDLRALDRVVACSSANARVLSERYLIDVDVILNGVDSSIFAPVSRDARNELRREIGMPSDAFVFIATCGCTKRKRTLQLVSAFMQAETPDDAMLYVLGGGPLFEECRKLSDGGKVRVVGRQDHVERWLACADRFVSLSEAEGMPMAALEAAACELPLILSRIPPHCEISSMLPDGVCELVDSVEDFAATVSASAAKSDTLSSYEAPHDIFSSRMATEYYAAYLDLAGQK